MPAQPTAPKDGEFPASWYDNAYESVGEYRVPYHNSRYYFVWTLIVDRLRIAPAHGVLEIGCGSGQLANLLADQGVGGYLGFDFSTAAISLAREHAKGEFRVDDAKTTELFESHSYDSVICTEVLEHIDFDLQILDRIPSGKRCICSVPSFPYVSHVRHFETQREVRARYEPYFSDFDLVELPMPGDRGLRYYLFDGIRNGRLSTAVV